MYFRLHADCIPVKGHLRSTLCDLTRQSYKLIPNELYDILVFKNKLSIEDIKVAYDRDPAIDEYFDFLFTNEYIFYCERKDELDLFPDLDLEYHYPGLISNFIIDVTTKSMHNYGNIFEQLKEIQCRHIQLRFFDKVELSDLVIILETANDKNFNSIELILKHNTLFRTEDLLQLFENYAVTIIFIHSVEEIAEELNLAMRKRSIPVYFVSEAISGNTHCGQVSPFYFNVNIEQFTEAQKKNSCLNKKIAIDDLGFIKNCPSFTRNWGHIANTTIKEIALNNEFQHVWNISKDQIEICRHCEYRYVCTDCRAFLEDPADIYSKPLKCSYNPFTATWE